MPGGNQAMDLSLEAVADKLRLEERLAQLEAENHRLRAALDLARRPDSSAAA